MRWPAFRAFWAATMGWTRRIPASLASPLARTAVVTGVVLGIAVMATLVVSAGVTLFAGVFTAPATEAMAFEPHAVSPVRIDPEEAQRARRDILSDPSNPLHCISHADMKSTARAVMSLPESDGEAAPAAAGNDAGAAPIQVTDETAAVVPEIEQVIATVPRGSDFFQTYAFVVVALNGGVDSWQRFVSVTTQLQLGTPTNRRTAMDTVRVFFTPDSDFTATDGLSAVVMMRLTSNRVVAGQQLAGETSKPRFVDGKQLAGELLEYAAQRCR